MRVLWIEDFGGLDAGPPTIANLFGNLLEAVNIYDEWEPNANLHRHPEYLAEFIKQHAPMHGAHLCRHYADFVSLCKANDGVGVLTTRFDVVVIDINLSRNAPGVLPKDGGYDLQEFQRRAGFYIHNELVLAGFPRERICFMTGELDTYAQFRDHCRAALMPLPTAFEKGDAGFRDFRKWLDGWCRNAFLTLRRGILDGGVALRQIIEKDSNCVRLQLFVRPKKPKDDSEPQTDADLEEQVLGHLDQLCQLLPSRTPTGDAQGAMLRLLARSITHDWAELKPWAIEKNYKIYKYKGPWFKHDELRIARAFGEVERNARDWLAHLQLIDLEALHVAFLFVANMRAWLKLDSTIMPHEQLLLKMFLNDKPALTREAIDDGLNKAYRLLGDDRTEDHNLKTEQSNMFSSIVHGDVKGSTRQASMELLYQIFWFQLSQPSCTPWFKPDVGWLLRGDDGNFVTFFAKAISGHSFSNGPT